MNRSNGSLHSGVKRRLPHGDAPSKFLKSHTATLATNTALTPRSVRYTFPVKIREFDYHLPPRLIAQHPPRRRDQSRLMVIERKTGEIRHCRFRDLSGLIRADDLLALNNSRVFPARLFAHRSGRNETIEILLVREMQSDVWTVLARPARKLRPGEQLHFPRSEMKAVVLQSSSSEVERRLQFQYKGDFRRAIQALGRTPLPPYIEREDDRFEQWDRRRYQTVYARCVGSVAAPTAGLHFTPSMLKRLDRVEITLHVGYGTFQPIRSEKVENHRMEAESFEISAEAAERIDRQLQDNRRVIAVGTTTTRTLEFVYRRHGRIQAEQGWTDLFIYPGFEFKVVGGLITNLHLPGSTLLLLVSAFAGKELIQEAYRKAVELEYRFYSYGDAMLIV